eukprot:SAG22_NODE_234_length_14360_cov_13.245915_12_plen_162_part_00
MAVLPVPVYTDAGGLVRVQNASGKIYFDSSYHGNPAAEGGFTAACSLETKLIWKAKSKAGDPAAGPPPFKAPPRVPMAGALAAMCASINGDYSTSIKIDPAAIEAGMKPLMEDGERRKGLIQYLHTGPVLPPAVKKIAEDTAAADNAEVKRINEKLAAGLN